MKSENTHLLDWFTTNFTFIIWCVYQIYLLRNVGCDLILSTGKWLDCKKWALHTRMESGCWNIRRINDIRWKVVISEGRYIYCIWIKYEDKHYFIGFSTIFLDIGTDAKLSTDVTKDNQKCTFYKCLSSIELIWVGNRQKITVNVTIIRKCLGFIMFWKWDIASSFTLSFSAVYLTVN